MELVHSGKEVFLIRDDRIYVFRDGVFVDVTPATPTLNLGTGDDPK